MQIHELIFRLKTLNPLIYLGILLILTAGLLGWSFLPNREPFGTVNENRVTPTPLPMLPQAMKKVTYLPAESDRLLEYVKKTTPLSSPDKAVRDRLIASLGGTSGILRETQTYTIEYVEAPDAFMVAVKSKDTGVVNREVSEWFRDQGVSEKGICHFPVVFYPAISADLLDAEPIPFNPIPEGC